VSLFNDTDQDLQGCLPTGGDLDVMQFFVFSVCDGVFDAFVVLRFLAVVLGRSVVVEVVVCSFFFNGVFARNAVLRSVTTGVLFPSYAGAETLGGC
jgi:hypothetical protein